MGSPNNLRHIPRVVVRFSDQNLIPIPEAKNLGIIFDRHLNWTSHVSYIIRRCVGMLNGLSHLRNYLPPSVVSSVVHALVLSQIRYCISVYGNGTKKNVTRIKKVVNYAAKVIFGRKKFDHVSDLLENLGWLNASELISYHTLCLTHKVRRMGEPETIVRALPRFSENCDRMTRQNDDFCVPMSYTEMGRRRFCCRAARQYNSLPTELRYMSIPAFGRHLRNYLVCDRD